MKMEMEWWTQKEVMRYFKIGRTTLFRWRKTRILVAHYIGHTLRFHRIDIERLIPTQKKE